jgi:low temperature requirement protein LtrA
MTGLLRDRGANGETRVGYIELFFDLVYVFAITQVSHYLLKHYDLAGVMQTAVLFLAIWWAWMYTAWATNWADVERAPVRMMLGALMLISLFMSAAIPNAFTDRGLMFALAYVTLQVGRNAFMTLIMWHARAHNWRNMLRILVYFIVAAPPWIIGAVETDPQARLLWWAAALAIEYAGPVLLFRVPGLGKSSAADWDISGAHMAERAGLFIIIALGEGIIVTGATFAGLPVTNATMAAMAIAVVGSFALWWIYFDIGATRGSEHIEHHANPGAVARSAYTYLHIPIVAGIVVIAVSDEQLLAHPTGHVTPLYGATLLGGTALFLAGAMAFKWMTSGRKWPPFSHIVGLMLIAALALWVRFGHPSPLALGAASVGLLVTVATWEWFSLHGGWRYWLLGERLVAEE